MRNFPRFIRTALLPLAVVAMIAGSSASASAATLQVGDNNTNVQVTVTAPTSVVGKVHIDSMNW